MLVAVSACLGDFYERVLRIGIDFVWSSPLEEIEQLLYVGVEEVEVYLLLFGFGESDVRSPPLDKHVPVLARYWQLPVIAATVQNICDVVGN